MVAADEFIDFAAGVFGVPPETLSLETTYGSIPAWDSMAQLRLVMDVAAKYGVEIPFAEVVTVTSLWEFLRRINGGAVKKVVAVDLDNTLWDGVIGEDDVEGIRPREDFQRELKTLKERGVLLVALSKNNEEDGLLGLSRQPVLKPDDFVALKIDWSAKAENLAQVAADLNLGTEAFVFVDDNPAERLEMSARLPEVMVASFPPRLAAYFPERPLTAEDRRKTEEYQAEAKRRVYLAGKGEIDIWTALGIELDVHVLRDAEVARVAQLSQKANQFNVCTHRHTEEDVRRLADEGLVVTAHAKDRFGDQGLVAFVIVRGEEILDWVMSCRVTGRGIEERVEAEVERLMAARGAARLTATWRASGKNVPVKDLFDRFGFALVSEAEDEKRYIRDLPTAP